MRKEREEKKVKVGLLGLGTVGTGVARIISAHQEELRNQTSSQIEITKVLVRDREKKRQIEIDKKIITTNADDVLVDPEIDIIVEVMGGIHPTKEYLLKALEQGKHVVTANKDLMALHGAEILHKAQEMNCDVYYEASVAGGIPILRALMDSFSSDRVTRIMGIVNGTTNYILSKMSREGADYEEVLKEAQDLGYAEADPSSDVGGLDAARKMVILSTLGFHSPVRLEDVYVQGIEAVSREDIAYAKKMGYEMKLLGLAAYDQEGIEISVQPTLIAQSHPLASVHGVFNAVYVYGEAVGETMFYGPGAGELPTATSVVSDLVSIVKNMKLGVNGRSVVKPYREKKLKGDGQKRFKTFLRLIATDECGVLAQITQLMSDYNISLEQVVQQPRINEKEAEIVLITHHVSKQDLDQVLAQLNEMDVIRTVKSCYRVEDGEIQKAGPSQEGSENSLIVMGVN
jgi:homoserine dehydrogenase